MSEFDNQSSSNLDEHAQILKVNSLVDSVYVAPDIEAYIDARQTEKYEDRLSDLYKISEYFDKYGDIKKLDKSDVFNMFYYFKPLMEASDFDILTTDYFTCFAEFFKVPYRTLYESIGVADKQDILKDMNVRTDGEVQRRMQSKKLF